MFAHLRRKSRQGVFVLVTCASLSYAARSDIAGVQHGMVRIDTPCTAPQRPDHGVSQLLPEQRRYAGRLGRSKSDGTRTGLQPRVQVEPRPASGKRGEATGPGLPRAWPRREPTTALAARV